jgi:hypothetical protein
MSLLGIIASSKKTARTLPVAGATLWLDADDITTFTFSSSNIVSGWNDLTATARNATQSTVAYQPTRVTGVLNGLPVVRFGQSTTKALSFSNVLANSTYTLFFVTNTSTDIISTGPSGPILAAGSGSAGSDGVLNYGGNWTVSVANERIYWATRGNRGLAYTAADISSGGHTYTITLNAPSSTGSISLDNSALSLTSFNGGFNSTNYAAGFDVLGNNQIGSAEGFQGDIGEMIYYPSVLSGGDISTIFNYLKTKWGTP